MPEPDFKMPTVYSRPTLRFGPKFGTSSAKERETYGTPFYPPVTARRKLTFGGFLNKAVGYKTHDEYALDAVNNALSYPQVNTPTIDAGSSVLDQLKGTAAAILSNMGSTGDGDGRGTPVAYSPRGEHSPASLLDSPVVLIGLVLGAGALIYAVNK